MWQNNIYLIPKKLVYFMSPVIQLKSKKELISKTLNIFFNLMILI